MSRKSLSKRELEGLAKLAALPEDRIDVEDIPEAPAENWTYARRGTFYRPLKQPVTIRLDADVVAWYKDHAPNGGYQTEINRVLREHASRADRGGRKTSSR